MKFILRILVLSSIAMFAILTGCSKSDAPKNGDDSKIDTTIVRDSTANLKVIDANNNGSVYTCPMEKHANVISDSAGICPLCKMDLEEVADSIAVKNLNAKYHPEEFIEKL